MFYVTSLFLFGRCFGLFVLCLCRSESEYFPEEIMSGIIEWMDSLLTARNNIKVMQHSLKLELYSTFYSKLKEYISVPVFPSP